MTIFLIGFMGCGKTTIGKKLAKKLKYDFIDLEEGPEQVLMMSTEVNRTMQSGYSEYIGMFPPNA